MVHIIMTTVSRQITVATQEGRSRDDVAVSTSKLDFGLHLLHRKTKCNIRRNLVLLPNMGKDGK